jgi:hypothetical protein
VAALVVDEPAPAGVAGVEPPVSGPGARAGRRLVHLDARGEERVELEVASQERGVLGTRLVGDRAHLVGGPRREQADDPDVAPRSITARGPDPIRTIGASAR